MDGHKHCGKCLRSRDGWTQTLLKMSAGHEMEGHKHCQKCLQVMR